MVRVSENNRSILVVEGSRTMSWVLKRFLLSWGLDVEESMVSQAKIRTCHGGLAV